MINEEKANVIAARYDEIIAAMSDPTVAADNDRYTKLSQELAEITPIVDVIKARTQAIELREEALELLSSGETELYSLANEQLAEAKKTIEESEEELMVLLRPKDPRDDRSVIMEIRGGAGGEEAALFASTLFDMYKGYAALKGYTVDIVDYNETELGGYKELIFEINGRGAYSRLKFESGVHRVQRVPETESGGRVHTSTATVAVLPKAEPQDVVINPDDLKIDRYRASGAGGQHINKTSSAVRITHLPTGIVVACQDRRSQFQNRDRAMEILQSKLWDMTRSSEKEAEDSERRSQVGTGDRSERIRTYNYHQGRVTDHRIGLTLYRLESILGGDLDEIVDALTLDAVAKEEKDGEE
ncbi:MAG: peptide chain release factor 1 [Saccharofermentans sp.]|nr:peptide chain release factor 1 [Saccharofermentans sp.]